MIDDKQEITILTPPKCTNRHDRFLYIYTHPACEQQFVQFSPGRRWRTQIVADDVDLVSINSGVLISAWVRIACYSLNTLTPSLSLNLELFSYSQKAIPFQINNPSKSLIEVTTYSTSPACCSLHESLFSTPSPVMIHPSDPKSMWVGTRSTISRVRFFSFDWRRDVSRGNHYISQKHDYHKFLLINLGE